MLVCACIGASANTNLLQVRLVHHSEWTALAPCRFTWLHVVGWLSWSHSQVCATLSTLAPCLPTLQYNITSALYMLDWWERLIFNILMASIFVGTVRHALVPPVLGSVFCATPPHFFFFKKAFSLQRPFFLDKSLLELFCLQSKLRRCSDIRLESNPRL